MKEIKITRRITTPFLQAIPKTVEEFDAFMYIVVGRKAEKVINEKYGDEVRIDPATLHLSRGVITIRIPLNINAGISSIDDLQEDWYESIEAAFLLLIHSCL